MTLSAEQPYAEVAAVIIGVRAEAVFAHSRKRVLDVADIELRHLHASVRVDGD